MNNNQQLMSLDEALSKFGLKEPPRQHCKHCGTLMNSKFVGIADDWNEKYNMKTGERNYYILVEYKCPNNKEHRHPQGLYSTSSKTWHWRTASIMTCMDT